MNLPNKLTAARIGMTVLMAVFILIHGTVWAWLSLAMYIAASLTDFFDGQIARKRGLVTNLGKFMDPLADKILNYSVMILLIGEEMVPPVAVVIILFREFLVAGIRQSAAEQGRVVAANIWGKAKTFVQDISLGVMLFFRALEVGFTAPLSRVLIWICAALTVISGAIYLVRNRDILKGAD